MSDQVLLLAWWTATGVCLALVGALLDGEVQRWWAERRERRRAAADEQDRERVMAALFGARPGRKGR